MSVANELDKFGKYVKQQAKSNLSKRKKERHRKVIRWNKL